MTGRDEALMNLLDLFKKEIVKNSMEKTPQTVVEFVMNKLKIKVFKGFTTMEKVRGEREKLRKKKTGWSKPNPLGNMEPKLDYAKEEVHFMMGLIEGVNAKEWAHEAAAVWLKKNRIKITEIADAK